VRGTDQHSIQQVPILLFNKAPL